MSMVIVKIMDVTPLTYCLAYKEKERTTGESVCVYRNVLEVICNGRG